MSMEEFVKTLSDEQRKALLYALSDKDSLSNKLVPEKVNKQTKKIISENFIAETKQESIKSQTNRRREPVRARENRWEDTGEFRDVETPDVERTPRKRPPPIKVDVECSSCGKSFKVDSRFVFGEYYRCNRCGSKR